MNTQSEEAPKKGGNLQVKMQTPWTHLVGLATGDMHFQQAP